MIDIPLETLGSLFIRHGLPVPRTVLHVPRGVTNPTFFVDDQVVVRVNTRDPELPKFDRESIAMRLAKEAGCQVPQVIFLDATCRDLNYPVLCTARAAGQPLDMQWSHLTALERESVGFSFGEALARIHTVECPHFGGLSSGEERFDDWTTFLRRGVVERANAALEFSTVPEELLTRVRTHLDSSIMNIPYDGRPCLTHGDYQPSNVTTLNGAISGVFDFEWALAADPEYDFRVIDNCVRKAAGIWPAFIDGYQSKRVLSENFGEKVLAYQLLWRLGITTLAKRFWGAPAHLECLKRLETICCCIERRERGPSLFNV